MEERLLLVDDHAIVRRGLRMILEARGFHAIVEAGSGIEALNLLKEFTPDVVILDIALPGMRGIDLASEILRLHPETKVIFLTMHKDEEYVHQAMSIGASGYLLKDCMDTEIVVAVHSVLKGRSYLTPMISREILSTYTNKFDENNGRPTFRELTSREREILTLLGEGKTNKAIAELLFISPRTVEHHRQNLMKKLSVSSIPELIKLAIKKKLIEL
jgi:two-component system response regulator NreC